MGNLAIRNQAFVRAEVMLVYPQGLDFQHKPSEPADMHARALLSTPLPEGEDKPQDWTPGSRLAVGPAPRHIEDEIKAAASMTRGHDLQAWGEFGATMDSDSI